MRRSRVRAAVLFALLVACRSPGGPAVVIHTAEGADRVVHVEVADDDQERIKGLMYRTDLAPDAGMLFLFGVEQPRAFWMKNTPLPLDILFIAKDGRIVSIAENTTPFSLKSIPSAAPAERVLEVNAGYVKRNGVKTGDTVTYSGVP